MQPFIAVSVIEVPVSVDEVLDRIGVEGIQSVRDPRPRDRETGVDKKFPAPTGQDGDVAAGALKNADIAPEWIDLDLGPRRFLNNCWHNPPLFCEELT